MTLKSCCLKHLNTFQKLDLFEASSFDRVDSTTGSTAYSISLEFTLGILGSSGISSNMEAGIVVGYAMAVNRTNSVRLSNPFLKNALVIALNETLYSRLVAHPGRIFDSFCMDNILLDVNILELIVNTSIKEISVFSGTTNAEMPAQQRFPLPLSY